jgi:hypothetical protein
MSLGQLLLIAALLGQVASRDDAVNRNAAENKCNNDCLLGAKGDKASSTNTLYRIRTLHAVQKQYVHTVSLSTSIDLAVHYLLSTHVG